MKEIKTIYIDMDGVLVDWFAAAAVEVSAHMLRSGGKFVDRLNREFPKGYINGQDMYDKFDPAATTLEYEAHNSWLPKASNHILNGNHEWWVTLPWTCYGKKILWECLNSGHDVKFLTTPMDSASKTGKREWIDREIGNSAQLLFSSDKYKYANENSLLIDDYVNNTEPFKSAGGLAFHVGHYPDLDLLIKEIEKLGEPA